MSDMRSREKIDDALFLRMKEKNIKPKPQKVAKSKDLIKQNSYHKSFLNENTLRHLEMQKLS
jgi:hypothetical protein